MQIKEPVVCGITSLGMDHTDVLGWFCFSNPKVLFQSFFVPSVLYVFLSTLQIFFSALFFGGGAEAILSHPLYALTLTDFLLLQQSDNHKVAETMCLWSWLSLWRTNSINFV